MRLPPASPTDSGRETGPAEAADAVRDLVARCRDGDAAAWDALVHRYERLIYTVAMRNGLTPSDAEDVAQATFEALLTAIDQVRDLDRLPYWLMTVARRLAWRQRERRARERPLVDYQPGVVDFQPDFDRHAAIHHGLDQLGAPCRELLVALYLDPTEPSYAEVAKRLGRAIGSIGPIRARCLARLRALLGEDV